MMKLVIQGFTSMLNPILNSFKPKYSRKHLKNAFKFNMVDNDMKMSRHLHGIHSKGIHLGE